MAELSPDVSEDMLMTAVRTFLLSIVTDCEVIQAQMNRVPMPLGDFIVMTPSISTALSTPIDIYSVNGKSIMRPTQFEVQLDFYGTKAQERSAVVSMLFRDDAGCRAFQGIGFELQPLYANDPVQMPIITGEEQFLSRWTLRAALQYNPKITLPQDFATEVEIGLIDVEVEYPVE